MSPPVPTIALEVDFLQRSVRVDGTPVDLTALEFGVLAALARDPGVVVTRAALLDLVWGPGFADEHELVDLHVECLRWKLGDAGPRLVETVDTLGFRLGDPD